MEYSHPDEELVKQPIGYWGWAAATAVVEYMNARLEAVDLSQPQWWTLSQVNGSANGRSRAEVTALLERYDDAGDALQREIDALLDWGLLALDPDERLQLTDDGLAMYRDAAATQAASRAAVHEGISDEDYLVTLKVLQRMIRNVDSQR